jgi:hypothetical protein
MITGSGSQSRKQVEELVFRPEDHRGLEHRPVETRRRDAGFRFALAAQVSARAARVGIERAHLDQPPDPVLPARLDRRFGHPDMHSGETRARRLVQHADQIDHRVRTADGGSQRRGVAHIDFGNLHAGQEEQRLGMLARATGHDDFAILVHQRIHDMTADEPGAAQDRDPGALHFSVSAWPTAATSSSLPPAE